MSTNLARFFQLKNAAQHVTGPVTHMPARTFFTNHAGEGFSSLAVVATAASAGAFGGIVGPTLRDCFIHTKDDGSGKATPVLGESDSGAE